MSSQLIETALITHPLGYPNAAVNFLRDWDTHWKGKDKFKPEVRIQRAHYYALTIKIINDYSNFYAKVFYYNSTVKRVWSAKIGLLNPEDINMNLYILKKDLEISELLK